MKELMITKPMEALDLLHMRTLLFDKYRWGPFSKTPGAVVFDAPEQVRDVLKSLKSEDIANIRPDYIWGPEANENTRKSTLTLSKKLI